MSTNLSLPLVFENSQTMTTHVEESIKGPSINTSCSDDPPIPTLVGTIPKHISLENIPVDEIVIASKIAQSLSYSPYSKFPVGAAILTEDGEIFHGCNIENSSYPLTVCAERAAVFSAVAQGHRKFKAISVITNITAPKWGFCCGACRQVLSEFGDFPILICRPNLEYFVTSVADLLPHSFSPSDLIFGQYQND